MLSGLSDRVLLPLEGRDGGRPVGGGCAEVGIDDTLAESIGERRFHVSEHHNAKFLARD